MALLGFALYFCVNMIPVQLVFLSDLVLYVNSSLHSSDKQ